MENVVVISGNHLASLACTCSLFMLMQELIVGGFFFADKSNSKIHLMFLQLLKDFEAVGTYSWGSACLAWLYRVLCWASHINAHDISSPLIILQLWIWDRFPFIAPQRLYSLPCQNNKQTINLKDGKCSCNKWQSFGIPCLYVLVVYAHARIDSWWILFCRQVK